ncbi:hypothetical protein COCC4DRAFT_188456 [Bipolaris maydis ATCC 48331]|uniref:Uncharacterized protein n=1 Tax=Cochliobolus heterostrophus (strain C4 / ATCC 48331 / race T) TaxID=665024 RepID=N4XJJ9_COCH4|nr:uncharacterized protein COCC4DRAFT_188456 [Bipolaris maydis ATCC 48331]ENI08758.1 hypothetical protein COCC4DRAFT_188456 [Bipolaris maydis ATCC 48331]
MLNLKGKALTPCRNFLRSDADAVIEENSFVQSCLGKLPTRILMNPYKQCLMDHEVH